MRETDAALPSVAFSEGVVASPLPTSTYEGYKGLSVSPSRSQARACLAHITALFSEGGGLENPRLAGREAETPEKRDSI